MATIFYLHDAASSNQSAKLPTAKQSSLSITDTIISASTNKSMNATAGTSEVSKSSGGTGSGVNWYIGRWVSDLCINQSSISADTWNFGNAAKNDGSSTFPVDSATSSKQYICIYVWRPSTGTVVGTIFDGFTTGSANNPGATEKTSITSVSGSAVSGIIKNDVLCIEWLAEGTNMSGTGSGTIYYDGTDTGFGGGNALSDIGSYIQWTTDIAFTPFSSLTSRSISDTVTAPTDSAKKKAVHKPADTSSIADSEAKLRRVPRTQADTLTITDPLKKFAVKKRPETVTLTDVLKKERPIFIAEPSLSIVDTIKKKATHKIAESVSLSDALVKSKLAIRALSQATGSITDSLKKLASKNIPENLGVISDISVKLARHKMTEAVGAIGQTNARLFGRALSQAVGSITDSLKKKAVKSISEFLGISESIQRGQLHKFNLATEAVGAISDSLLKHHRFLRGLVQTVKTVISGTGNT